MRFTPISYKNLPLYDAKFKGRSLAFVDQTKYLGHIISSDLSDALDIEKT